MTLCHILPERRGVNMIIFQLLWSLAFFRYLLSYSSTFLEFLQKPFIWILGLDCSHSITYVLEVSHTSHCLSFLQQLFIPDIGIMVRVFTNGPWDRGLISGRVIPKTQKMVLDATLLNTQHYKVRIKGKVE